MASGPDDLFITGDPHQRIYDSRVSLNALGISVVGRSSRLRVNYRSTEEILTWSTGVLVGSRIEDLAGDGDDSLVGYRSLLHGKRPHAVGYPTSQAEIAALVERVGEWLKQGVAASEIAVCARFNTTLGNVQEELTAAGIPAARLRDSTRAICCESGACCSWRARGHGRRCTCPGAGSPAPSCRPHPAAKRVVELRRNLFRRRPCRDGRTPVRRWPARRRRRGAQPDRRGPSSQVAQESLFR